MGLWRTSPTTSSCRCAAACRSGTSSAGRPSLDFVNTLRERWWRNVETLVTPGDLVRWLERAELLRSGRARGRRARCWTRRASCARASTPRSSRRSPARPCRGVRSRRSTAGCRPRSRPRRSSRGPGGVAVLRSASPADPVRHALGAVALDAARMLGSEQRARARICASDTCSARFYDRSPTAGRGVVLDARLRQRREGAPPSRAAAPGLTARRAGGHRTRRRAVVAG